MAQFSGEKEFTIMQFIDKVTGERHNYYPDMSPESYAEVCKVICLFRVKKKSVPPFWERFRHYWKLYKV